MKKIDQLYDNIDLDLSIELDNKVLYCLDKEAIDFCVKLEDLAVYIECKVEYVDFLPLDVEPRTYSSLVNLIPYHNCPPIITGFGESTISSAEAKDQAAKTALELFKIIKSRNDNS